MTRFEYYSTSFPRLVTFYQMLPTQRLAYTKTTAGAKWLSELTPEELDTVSELLCEAAPSKLRHEYPIIDTYIEEEASRETHELSEGMQ